MVTKLFSGKHGKIVVIQDDYHFWKDNNYIPGAGKPLWLSLDRPNTHHIFFDDHINNNSDDSIVCVRYRESSSNNFISLSGEKIRQQHGMFFSLSLSLQFFKHEKKSGTFMVRAHALKAAFDPDYYLKKISACEKNYSKLLSLSSSECRKRFT